MVIEVPFGHAEVQAYIEEEPVNRAVLDFHVNHSGRGLRTWVTRASIGGGGSRVTGVLAWGGPDLDADSWEGQRVIAWAEDRDGAADLLSILPGERGYFLFGSSLSAILAAEERFESPDELRPAITYACSPLTKVAAPSRPVRAIHVDEVSLVNQHWDLGGGNAEGHLRHKITTWPSGLIEVDGTPAGWSGVHFATSTVMNLGFLFVLPEHRGKGLARDLTRHMVRVVRERRLMPICHIYADNTPSRLMTESEGFGQVGKAYWQRFEPV